MKKQTPTPHNGAEYGEIAKTVLMSGDPLRSKFIAENYLTDPKLYNQVRGMLGFTGTYNGKEVSVQGHGMGIPSIGIYSYELFKFYDVDTIVRIGTCGAFNPDVKLGSIIIANTAYTDSNYGYQYGYDSSFRPEADKELLDRAVAMAEKKGLDYLVGPVFSSDVFYNDSERQKKWIDDSVLGVEMEATALYMNAHALGKKALTILSVSDNIATGELLSAEQRQVGLKNMIELALDLV
jgi:purine-nucleoside phosphorylase, family 1 (deoD)